MKKLFICGALAAALFALAACRSPAGSGEAATVTISFSNVAAGARAVDWPPTTDNEILGEILHTITLTSDGQTPHVMTGIKAGGPPATFSVVPGLWRVEVVGTLAGFLFATGDNEVNVIAGPNNRVKIQMERAGELQDCFIVHDADDWAAAVEAITGAGQYAIILKEGFELEGTSAATFGTVTGIEVGIQGNGHTISLESDSTGSLFRIGVNQNVIINGLTLQGHSNNGVALVYINGADATFTMNSGELLDNGFTIDGGAVRLLGSTSTFTMNGGKISGNSSAYGGGVSVSSGTFIMNGGEISGNTANGNVGGGVRVTNGGTFTMTGGVISGNTATSLVDEEGNGGGVHIGNGTFHIVNGTIYGSGESAALRNTATGEGAALFKSDDATAQYGTIDENGGWVSAGDLDTTDDTIRVANGVKH